uniref:Uncharacterized protein n=1 Tax=Oryza barthii TaxID=65489 RepID=A0A0D3GM73_9ORYZ
MGRKFVNLWAHSRRSKPPPPLRRFSSAGGETPDKRRFAGGGAIGGDVETSPAAPTSSASPSLWRIRRGKKLGECGSGEGDEPALGFRCEGKPPITPAAGTRGSRVDPRPDLPRHHLLRIMVAGIEMRHQRRWQSWIGLFKALYIEKIGKAEVVSA